MKRLAVGAAAMILVAVSAASAGEPTRLDVDLERPGPVISPRLFGHNLEITRRGAWHGLYAELVANRKFAGDAKADGLPPHWYPITGGGRVGVEQGSALAGKQCVRVEVATAGRTCGIGQYEGLALQEGTKYALRVWLKSDAPRHVWVRLGGGAGDRVDFEHDGTIAPGDWQIVRGAFTAAAGEASARLEIGSEQGGVFRIGAVSLQPADAFHGLRRDVVDLLKQLGPGVIRWPGGCFAEYYRWQEGLLPVDRRPPLGKTTWELLLPDTDGYDTHEIGIDEFVALCREVGAEPAITVRLGEGSPEEMAAWVEYCNGGPDSRWGKVRVERGHRAPYRVTTWFVGNEIYWSGLNGSTDPKVFARLTRQFAEAMKKADPSIQLIGGTWFDAGNLDRWERPMLESAGPLLDLASFHQYLGIGSDAEIGPRIKAATSETRARLHAVRQYLDTRAPGGTRLGIAFDEWNLNWGRLPGDVPGGLFAAGMLNLLGREAQPLRLALACYFMPVNEGCIEVRPGSAWLNADGQVFALYRAHQGSRLLTIPPRPDDSDLDACASIAPDGQRLHVTLVNRSLSRTIPVELAFHGTVPAGGGAVRRLVPRGLSQGSSFAEVDEPLSPAGPGRYVLELVPGSIARVRLGPAAAGESLVQARPRPVLLAHYPFEETSGTATADASGHHAAARLVGAAEFIKEGRFGRAIALHGTRDWIDTGSSLVDTSESFSVAAWVWLDPGFEATFRTAVSQDDDRVSGFYLQYSPTTSAGLGSDSLRLIRWRDTRGEALKAVALPGRPRAGRWTHLAGVMDAEDRVMRLYVDGRAVAETGIDGMGMAYRWPSKGHTIIGRGQFGGGPVDPYLGRIDEVYLFQSVLGPRDVVRVMENQFTAAVPAGRRPADSGERP